VWIWGYGFGFGVGFGGGDSGPGIWGGELCFFPQGVKLCFIKAAELLRKLRRRWAISRDFLAESTFMMERNLEQR
jgi:hypothetical protein